MGHAGRGRGEEGDSDDGSENEEEDDDVLEDDDEDDEDEEEDEEEEDEEEEEEKGASRAMKRPRLSSSAVHNAKEEEEDEDEDESENEKDTKKKKASKRSLELTDSQAIRSHFFEEAAESDEDEDEDEEGDYDFDDGEAAEAAKAEQSLHRRILQEQTTERQRRTLGEMMEDRLKEGAFDDDEYEDEMDDFGEGEAGEASDQASRLPNPRTDPHIWLVKCKPGKEKQVVVDVMHRYLARRNTPKPLEIISAIACAHLTGFIYIEAMKEAHVREAALIFRGTVMSYNFKLVPTNEMIDILRVNQKKIEVTKNAWVRVKRGIYRGDIAQIEDYDDTRNRVTLRIVPRIDFQQIIQKLDASSSEDRKRKRTQRPIARVFNAEEVATLLDAHPHLAEKLRVERVGDSLLFMGQKFKDGYLVKTWNIRSIEVSDVHPTLPELQKFQNKSSDDSATPDNPLRSLPAVDLKRAVKFVKGDKVVVTEGSLKNLMGTVLTVEEHEVTLMPTNVALRDAIRIVDTSLRKHFQAGDHVKVVGGQYVGETGLVLKLEGNIAIIHTDSTMQELRLLSQDIQQTSEVTSGMTTLGGYDLHDLVQLDAMKAGVIIKVEREGFKVLTNEDCVETVLLAAVKRKLMDSRSNAHDHSRSPLSVGDAVKVVDGKYDGKTGTIKHIYKYILFLHIKDRMEHAGIICVRTNQTLLVGERSGEGDRKQSIPRPIPYDGSRGGRGSFPMNSRGMGGRGAGRGAGRGRGRDPLVGQTMRVTRGPYKGYIGTIKSATDTLVQLELHTKDRVVSLSRGDIADISSPSPLSAAPSTGYAPTTPYGTFPHTPLHTPFQPSTPSGTATPRRGIPGTPHSAPGTPYDRDSVWDAGSLATPASSAAETPNISSEWGSSLYSAPSSYAPPPSYSAPPTYADTPNLASHLRTPFPDAPSYRDPSVETPHIPPTPGDVYAPTPGGVSVKDWQNPPTPSPLPSRGRGGVSDEWIVRGLCVLVGGGGGKYVDRVAVVQSVQEGVCQLVGEDDRAEKFTVPSSLLRPVLPKTKGDRVMIIHGDRRHTKMTFVAFDGDEGVLRPDGQGEIYIAHLSRICRYVEE